MARFDVTIEGDDLGRARAALDTAGIATTGLGTEVGLRRGGRIRRRSFHSAAFPILLVIVIAFFAQRLIGPDEEEGHPSYDQFLAQVEQQPGTIERVTLDPSDTALEVDERNGDRYEIGYPPSAEELLVGTLRRQGVETVVEQTGGGSLLSLITYVLPFLLFFGFWLFLMNRMQARGGGSRAGSWDPRSLEAAVEAESSAEAEQRVRTALPADGDYRLSA